MLQFSYSKSLVDAVKSLPVRTYNPETNEWLVGFDRGILPQIIALLRSNTWDPTQLDAIEAECIAYLDSKPQDEPVFDVIIKPTITQLASLVESCYLDGKINQQQQMEMIHLLNHLTIKDFIKRD